MCCGLPSPILGSRSVRAVKLKAAARAADEMSFLTRLVYNVTALEFAWTVVGDLPA